MGYFSFTDWSVYTIEQDVDKEYETAVGDKLEMFL